MSDPYALALEAAEARPVVTLGSGLPTEIDGEPVTYRLKEIARVGSYTHRGSRKEFSLPRERLSAIADSARKRIAKGIRPPITPYHVDPDKEFDANETLGYVVDVRQEGDSLYGVLQLIGDRARSAAARNDVSIATVDTAVDQDGGQYGEVLHHLSLTPDPALSHLRPYLKIAASAAGGAAREVRIFTLSAAVEDKPMFKPETLTALRKRLKLADDAPESDVAEKAAALALADPPPDKSAEVTALSAKVQALETERDAAKSEAETLRLSATAPKEPDALSLSLITRAFKTDRERVIESGVVSEAGMKEIDALLLPAGKPAPFALALSAGSPDPLYSRLCDVLRRHPGVKTDNQVRRDGVQLSAAPRHESFDPNAKEPEKPITPERKKELLAHVGA